MKNLLVLLALLCLAAPAVAQTPYNVDEATHQKYKAELEKRGWLYGCTPPNWSLVEPFRGGFVYAAQHDKVDIMELEVKAGLNPVDCGNNLVTSVIMFNKKPEALDFLLKNGFNPDTILIDCSFLTFAISRKNVEAVKALIYNGANVNLLAKGKSPLNYAIKKKQPEIVAMLLKAGAKPDDKTMKLVEKSKNPAIKALFE
ncbi:MAG: ankyrin repeat domain-containing protein [Heliobacteriaceae bacterium]|nr:ankyrin repeat domain-containing protein [Heliobacteriaceae bacterium]